MINYANSWDVVAQLTCKNKKQFSCKLEMPPWIFFFVVAKMRYRLKVVEIENNHTVSWNDDTVNLMHIILPTTDQACSGRKSIELYCSILG